MNHLIHFRSPKQRDVSVPAPLVRRGITHIECNAASDQVPNPMPTSTPSPSSSSKPAAKPIPNGFHTVTPYLVCDGASDAITFYEKAFGATELLRVPTPKGKLMHASIKIGDSIIMLNDEFPKMGALGPKERQGSSGRSISSWTTLMLHLPARSKQAPR